MIQHPQIDLKYKFQYMELSDPGVAGGGLF